MYNMIKQVHMKHLVCTGATMQIFVIVSTLNRTCMHMHGLHVAALVPGGG